MSKKFLKIFICFISISTFIAGIIYFMKQKKAKENMSEETETEEENLDSMNALDLSSLKFSHHYVDLR